MSTSFFEQQDAARRATGWLVVFFVLAVVSIVAVIYVLAAAIYAASQDGQATGAAAPGLWNPPLLLWVGLGTTAVILLGTLYKIAELARGGETVALLLGGRLIDPQTKDLAERRLLNVVEEMALASGTPCPPVYVLDREPSINAFAAGHQPSDAVIGVSRGCLDYLTRDELQGVMAHEFSHILNGDMRLNLRLTGTVFGILVLAIVGYYLMRFSGAAARSSRKQGAGVAAGVFLGGLALFVIGYLGVLFGKLIKCAVSRQREYLADAAAVQFTRYPAGIAGALKKIGGLPARSRIRDAHAEEVSHMFFCDALEGTFANFFATHPPLAKRIQRIDPSFDGRFPEVAPLAEADAAAVAAPRPAPAGAIGDEQAREIREFLQTARQEKRKRAMPLGAGQAISATGAPGAAQLLFASALVASMPPPLVGATREPYAARALVYALLLAEDEAVRRRQLGHLQRHIEQPLYGETLRLAAEARQLSDEARAPLIDMSFPALKRLSAEQYAAFRDNVEALVQADARIDLFEYMVRSLLLRNLDVHFGRAKPVVARYYAVTPLVKPLVTVLSTLAYAGQQTQEAAEHAFQQGIASLGRDMPILAKADCTLGALDAALEELAQAAPKVQQIILASCVACVAADGKATVRESELLRAVAGTLGCPMPPLPPGLGT